MKEEEEWVCVGDQILRASSYWTHADQKGHTAGAGEGKTARKVADRANQGLREEVRGKRSREEIEGRAKKTSLTSSLLSRTSSLNSSSSWDFDDRCVTHCIADACTGAAIEEPEIALCGRQSSLQHP